MRPEVETSGYPFVAEWERTAKARTGDSRFLATLGMTDRKARATAEARAAAEATAKTNTGILRFALG